MYVSFSSPLPYYIHILTELSKVYTFKRASCCCTLRFHAHNRIEFTPTLFFYSNNDVKLSSQSVQKAHARQRKKIKSDRCHSSPGHSGLPAPGSSIRRYFRYLPIKSGNRVSNTNAGYSTEKQRDNLNKPDRIITQTVPKPGLSGEIAEAEANRTKNPLDCILRHNKCVFQS